MFAQLVPGDTRRKCTLLQKGRRPAGAACRAVQHPRPAGTPMPGGLNVGRLGVLPYFHTP